MMRAFVMATWLTLLAGCGDEGPRRYQVAGEVTFAGQPVPAGQVIFEPDASAGHDGPQGFADIRQGRFDTAQSGRGTIAGPHRVRVIGMDGVGATDDAPLGRALFPPYDLTVDLPPARHTLAIEVPAAAGP